MPYRYILDEATYPALFVAGRYKTVWTYIFVIFFPDVFFTVIDMVVDSPGTIVDGETDSAVI